MPDIYKLDGIPSDLVTGAYGDRKFKVSGTFQSAGESALPPLSNKAFTWNQDGSIDTITVTDKTSGDKHLVTFNYNQEGLFLNIDVAVI